MIVRAKQRGFTLIELLVVVAIIALLISILLPSLKQAREQAKQAKCLANLKNIGNATQNYALEDSKELVLPVHKKNVEVINQAAVVRTGIWFMTGGRSAVERFTYGVSVGGGGAGTWMLGNEWGAKTRPLNRFMYTNASFDEDTTGNAATRPKNGPAFDLPAFECPSDVGYPESPYVDDIAPGGQGKVCYNIFGNSYRSSLVALFWGSGSSDRFSLGPFGQTLSNIPNTSRVVLMGEPTWFNMIHRDDGSNDVDPIVLVGWHKKFRIDNLLYCDGSASPTFASYQYSLDTSVAGPNAGWTSRGESWQLDVYPSPGARVLGARNFIRGRSEWPFGGYADNLD
ncbi:MAG: prepilin-type N-terminal cleavage/methylation domain-containing protein [Phycisphaerales bacterium]|nr:prepilin-type N-terminal cleavage/methylation domain-containing protein [Phycisphaerales bacterium]